MASFNHKAPRAVKRAGIVDVNAADSFNVRQSKTILARCYEAGVWKAK